MKKNNICIVCSKKFEKGKKTHIFCSYNCFKISYRKRKMINKLEQPILY